MNERAREDHRALTEKLIGVLDAGTRRLDDATLSRLYASRRQAVSALQARHGDGGALVLMRHPALSGLGLAVLLLTGAWLALRHPVPHPSALQDTSELDVQLLTGELPPQVFADWSLVTRENVESVCLTDS